MTSTVGRATRGPPSLLTGRRARRTVPASLLLSWRVGASRRSGPHSARFFSPSLPLTSRAPATGREVPADCEESAAPSGAQTALGRRRRLTSTPLRPQAVGPQPLTEEPHALRKEVRCNASPYAACRAVRRPSHLLHILSHHKTLTPGQGPRRFPLCSHRLSVDPAPSLPASC